MEKNKNECSTKLSLKFLNLNYKELNKEQILYFIYLADKCGKYEDVLLAFENLVGMNSIIFHKNERYIFDKSTRMLINNKRIILKKLYHLTKEAQKKIEQDKTNSEDFVILHTLEEEKIYIKIDIQNLCDRILQLIDIYLKNIQNFSYSDPLLKVEKENETFFYQLKGDLYKYMFQVAEDFHEENINIKNAEENFIEAYKLAITQLDIFSQTSLSAIYAYAEFLQKYKCLPNDALEILMPIYEMEETKNILNGVENADTQSINLLNEIKVMISKILHDEEDHNTI